MSEDVFLDMLEDEPEPTTPSAAPTPDQHLCGYLCNHCKQHFPGYAQYWGHKCRPDPPTPKTCACCNDDCHEKARRLERERDEARRRITELETELESHAWEISPAMAQAKIDQLNAQLDEARAELLAMKLPEFDRCETCNTELSQCGPQDTDGEPTLDCLVCSLGERLKEARAELARTKEAYVEILRRYTRGQAELAQLKSDLALIDAIEKEARLTEGSAVEWVKTKLFPVHDDDGRTHFDLSEYHSLELARRADEAEKRTKEAELMRDVKASRPMQYHIDRDTIKDLRVQLAAAQGEARELREALEWLEDEVPQITHDSWTCSVDMAGNRWTLQFRNDGKRERIRGRTLIDAISKAIAALAKKEGER